MSKGLWVVQEMVLFCMYTFIYSVQAVFERSQYRIIFAMTALSHLVLSLNVTMYLYKMLIPQWLYGFYDENFI